jgi:hypothetical protein
MAEKSWYSTGFNKGNGGGGDGGKSDFLSWGPDRVWIPAGQSRDFVFVDDAPFTFDEHNARINGSWRNPITCLAPVTEEGEPPCCTILGKDSRYRVSMLTIVDTSKWTDKKGNVRQYELKILPAKFKTSQKLERKMNELAKDGKSLVGRLYKVVRETDKSPAVGDDYEFTRDVDMTKLFDLATYKGKKLSDLFTQADDDAAFFTRLSRVFAISKGMDGKIPRKLVPFRYDALFQPKTVKEVKELLAGFSAAESGFGGGNGGGGSADEEIPF